MLPASFLTSRAAQGGATLVEVLVTVAVSSIALLGMAGLMIVSQRVNQDAYLRTQANFIAQSLVDSMHINPKAVSAGTYNGIYGTRAGSDIDCESSGCTPAQRAVSDLSRFDASLAAMLPNASASVDCSNEGAPSPPTEQTYSGLCELKIGWVGAPLGGSSRLERGDDAQTLVWVFQP